MKYKKLTTLILVASMLISCATSKNPNDHYEHYNRAVFYSSTVVDKYVVRPVAVTYTYIPSPIRYVIHNFNENLHGFVSLANDILQLDAENTLQTTLRVGVNSTIGLLGLIKVSSYLGIKDHSNTFGNTLKTYGWTNSSYFLVPLFGPGTVRDQIGLVPDTLFNPTFWVPQFWGSELHITTTTSWVISGSLSAVYLVDKRSQYLDTEILLAHTLDPYATVRDLYLQSTNNFIYESSINDTQSNEGIDSLISEENSIK